MTTHETSTAPHEALSVFIGDWHAEGHSYGGDEQTADNPRGGASPWRSIHTGRWHSGGFFVVQDERANGPFDTLGFLGWDPEAERYFAWSVENHGYCRAYSMDVDGDLWTITGDQERARIVIGDQGRTQTHTWERKVDDTWLPLCDRVATRVD